MLTVSVEVSFPGGKKVDAGIREFTIRTDQSIKVGGEASAPEPFDLFLASIATCAGVNALGFCQARNLETAGLALRMVCERDEQKKLFTRLALVLSPPAGFPEKYRAGILRAMELCAVKRHIVDAPEFVIELSQEPQS